MHTHHRTLLLALLVGAVGGPRLASSQTVCRPADKVSASLIHELARYSAATTGGNAVVRDSLRLPYTPAAQVVLVTNESVCKKANAAYQADRAGKGGGLSGRVYVVAVGNTYAVLDPSYRYDPTWPHPSRTILIVSSRFERLSLF